MFAAAATSTDLRAAISEVWGLVDFRHGGQAPVLPNEVFYFNKVVTMEGK